MKKRVNILSIAGFDPSGGAGLLADVKTFELHKCYGMAVQTANTVQTANSFNAVNWIADELVNDQLDTLLNEYAFAGVKIGLVASFDFLVGLIDRVREKNPKAVIVWDPVLSASAGFDFHKDTTAINRVLTRVDWITPNWKEMQVLGKTDNALEAAIQMSNSLNVYLKGGHNPESLGKDYWLYKGEMKAFNPKKGKYSEKHGSGCVFSSALAANLAKGFPPQKAVLKSKRYIEELLGSAPAKLGYHYG